MRVAVDFGPSLIVAVLGFFANTCRQFGGALAVAVFGALVAHRDTFLEGLRVGLLIAALLLLATAAASLSLRPPGGAERAGAVRHTARGCGAWPATSGARHRRRHNAEAQTWKQQPGSVGARHAARYPEHLEQRVGR